MAHYSSLNKSKTIKNAKEILERYSEYHNLEISMQIMLKSPSMSGMPSAPSYGNNQEDQLIEQTDERAIAANYCQKVRIAIDCIEDESYRKILNDSYINKKGNDLYIMREMYIGRRQFYEKKKHALLTFCQLCPELDLIDGKKQKTFVVR